MGNYFWTETGNGIEKDDFPYQLADTLGRGGFAVVKRGIEKGTGKQVAVKIIAKRHIDQDALARLHEEIDILGKIEHENVVKLEGIVDTKSKLYIVMEL